jgi:hypothetical protein
MASSQFWQERAPVFLQVPGHEMLRADGQYTVGSGKSWHWQFAGGATEFTRETFENLARGCAFEIAPTDTTDLLIAWLETIRKECINFRSDITAYDVNEDGTEGSHYVAGTIDRVCEASAILCRRLASRALQAEFEERQRSDPKNWSPLRQRFEAFKSIKELQTGPHEQIPEGLVRDAIADQLGIKPDKVTWKQIQFEVAGLLRDYPAITLIPTEPAPSQPEIASPACLDPKALRDSYLANFPDEKIKIRDLCWAAGQHYREWKRWLAGELKDGSTPDLAFRRILLRGKRPLEFNKKPRPDGWE